MKLRDFTQEDLAIYGNGAVPIGRCPAIGEADLADGGRVVVIAAGRDVQALFDDPQGRPSSCWGFKVPNPVAGRALAKGMPEAPTVAWVSSAGFRLIHDERPPDECEYVLQGDYGRGWCDIIAEETAEEARVRRTEYEVNEGPQYKSRYRIVRRRGDGAATEEEIR